MPIKAEEGEENGADLDGKARRKIELLGVGKARGTFDAWLAQGSSPILLFVLPPRAFRLQAKCFFLAGTAQTILLHRPRGMIHARCRITCHACEIAIGIVALDHGRGRYFDCHGSSFHRGLNQSAHLSPFPPLCSPIPLSSSNRRNYRFIASTFLSAFRLTYFSGPTRAPPTRVCSAGIATKRNRSELKLGDFLEETQRSRSDYLSVLKLATTGSRTRIINRSVGIKHRDLSGYFGSPRGKY